MPSGDIHVGVNLDDVLRVIVWDLKKQYGWSTNAAARHLGIAQPTLADFLSDEEKGMRVLSLSRMCAALKKTPTEFLKLHERYDAGESVPFLEDAIFGRFRALLTRDQALDLIRVLETLNKRGSVPVVIEAAVRALGLDAPPPDEGRAKARKKKTRARSRRR